MQHDLRIIQLCTDRFRELESFELVLPFARVSALEQLKNTPRTGKKIRLPKLGLPRIKARTVYDHTAALAYNAAALLPCESDLDLDKLSSLIVYHDVNEILIGDVAEYMTEYTQALPESAARHRMVLSGKEQRESAANSFLWLFGDENHKKAFEYLNGNSREKAFLKAIDRVDPIITIWRYMRVYNDLLKERAKPYIETMSDFFTYPVLWEFMRSCPYKPLTAALKILSDKNAAYKYIENLNLLDLTDDGEVRELLAYLIEQTPLFFN